MVGSVSLRLPDSMCLRQGRGRDVGFCTTFYFVEETGLDSVRPSGIVLLEKGRGSTPQICQKGGVGLWAKVFEGPRDVGSGGPKQPCLPERHPERGPTRS